MTPTHRYEIQRLLRWLLLCGCAAVVGCEKASSPVGRGNPGGSAIQSPPQASWDELEIEVVGDEFQWHLRYPGRDGKLGTPDDRLAVRDVHLPPHTPTRLVLKSKDYLYTYSIPHLNQKEIAVPDMEFTLEFVTSDPGRHEFRGDQFCGDAHPRLSGQFIVDTAADFQRWLDTLDTVHGKD